MAQITVTEAEMQSKAQSLQQLNERFSQAIAALESVETNLFGMWDGEAKDAFHKAFNNDKVQLENFKKAIDKYVEALLAIIKQYQQAEMMNVNTATQRI